MQLKKKIDGAANINKPKIELEASLNEISVANLRSTLTKNKNC